MHCLTSVQNFCLQIFWISVFIPFHCQDRFIIVISYVTWFTFSSTGFTSYLGMFMKYFSESLVITLHVYSCTGSWWTLCPFHFQGDRVAFTLDLCFRIFPFPWLLLSWDLKFIKCIMSPCKKRRYIIGVIARFSEESPPNFASNINPFMTEAVIIKKPVHWFAPQMVSIW